MIQSKASEFGGVYPAMPSCYDNRGKINVQAVKELTRFLVSSGVNGVYVCGSTGEGPLQSAEERKKVLEAVIEEGKGKFKIIAHIGAITTEESVNLAVHAEAAGADAISSIPPYYYKTSEQAVKNHWLSMIEATSLPFIIYHIPSTTGFHLTTGLFQEMISHERVVGLKITTSSCYELQQFKALGGEDFAVFNGPDEQYIAGRVMGACGGIGGTYSAMPELFVKIENCYLERDLVGARMWQYRVNEVISELLTLPVYAAVKEIIKLRGVDCGTPRLPNEQLSQRHYPVVKQLKDKIMSYVAEC